MKAQLASCVLSLCVFAPSAWTAEFEDLAREYDAAKKSIGGAKRQEKVKKNVAPILKKIGEIDSDQSLKFLLQEMESPTPEISAACAAPVLASSHPKAVAALLNGFSRRHRTVQSAILSGLAATKKDLEPYESQLVRIASTVKGAQLKKPLPAILGKLDSPAAAKALLGLVESPRGRGGEASAAQDTLRRGVVEALVKTGSEEVKTWLASGAFSAARSSPAKLAVLAEIVGRLKLARARKDLERLVDHKSPETAAAAVDAIRDIGAEPSLRILKAALARRKGPGDLPFRVRALDAIASALSAEGLEAVLAYAGGKDPEMRAVAMGSLGLMKSPAALQALLKSLDDANPNIRSTALAALSRKRDKAMVEPLIEHLGKESERRLRIDTLRMLVGLTGHNMGFEAADWKKWWEIEEPRFSFPEVRDSENAKTKLRIADPDEVVPKYFGMEITSSKKLAFLVDISSSMTQQVDTKKGGKARKIDILKKELTRVLEKLSKETLLNITSFHGSFSSWQRKLLPLSGSGRARAIKYVKDIRTGVGTNVFDTLEYALKDRSVDTIYLLTDGQPTRGRIIDPLKIVEEVRVLNRTRGVAIHCIAFGQESKLLQNLAKEHKGQYKFVNEY